MIFAEMDPIPRRWSKPEKVGLGLLFAYVAVAVFAMLFDFQGRRPAAENGTEPIEVKHRLLLRTDVEHKLVVRLAPELLRERRISLALDRSYMEAMELQGTAPHLLAARLDGDRLVLDFPVDQRDRPLSIRLAMRTVKAGAPAGEIGVLHGPRVHVRQFVSP